MSKETPTGNQAEKMNQAQPGRDQTTTTNQAGPIHRAPGIKTADVISRTNGINEFVGYNVDDSRLEYHKGEERFAFHVESFYRGYQSDMLILSGTIDKIIS